MEDQQRNQVILKKLPLPEYLLCPGVKIALILNTLIEIVQTRLAVLVFDEHVVAVYFLDGTDALDVEKDIILAPVLFPLHFLHAFLHVLWLVVFPVVVVVVFLEVLHLLLGFRRQLDVFIVVSCAASWLSLLVLELHLLDGRQSDIAHYFDFLITFKLCFQTELSKSSNFYSVRAPRLNYLRTFLRYFEFY